MPPAPQMSKKQFLIWGYLHFPDIVVHIALMRSEVKTTDVYVNICFCNHLRTCTVPIPMYILP